MERCMRLSSPKDRSRSFLAVFNISCLLFLQLYLHPGRGREGAPLAGRRKSMRLLENGKRVNKGHSAL